MLSISNGDNVNELQENVWSKRQWIVLIATSTAAFGCAICSSLQAPFFPAEAELKHVRSTVYGFVFGVYSFSVFVTAPMLGNYIGEIGPLFLLNAGTFVISSCYALFGLLDKMKSNSSFITFAFIIRIIEAIGRAAVLTSTYPLIARAFPGYISKSFAFIRAINTIGLAIGPTVGGSLYQVGGFTLPFVCTSGFLLAVTIINTLMFWSDNENYTHFVKATNISHVLSIPSVTLSMITTAVCSFTIGFFEITLEPHLRQFNVTPVAVGLTFFTLAISETVGYALVSLYTNKKKFLTLVTASGLFLICIAYLIIGPAPFIPFAGQFWMSIVAMVFNGLGVAIVLLTTQVDAFQASILNGFPDSFQTYGLINGIWTSFYELGHFTGPSVSGVIYDRLGFRLATQIPMSFLLIMVVANVCYYFVYDVPRIRLKQCST